MSFLSVHSEPILPSGHFVRTIPTGTAPASASLTLRSSLSALSSSGTAPASSSLTLRPSLLSALSSSGTALASSLTLRPSLLSALSSSGTALAATAPSLLTHAAYCLLAIGRQALFFLLKAFPLLRTGLYVLAEFVYITLAGLLDGSTTSAAATLLSARSALSSSGTALAAPSLLTHAAYCLLAIGRQALFLLLKAFPLLRTGLYVLAEFVYITLAGLLDSSTGSARSTLTLGAAGPFLLTAWTGCSGSTLLL
ncbi:MAG: hypothetical protein ABIG11_03500 [bacterium]